MTVDAGGFTEWIEQELARRGWKPSDLAREAGLDQGTLSNVLSGARGPGVAFCSRVAEALQLPVETVLGRAGLISLTDESTEAARELGYLFDRLSPEDQQRALVIVRALLHAGSATQAAPAGDQEQEIAFADGRRSSPESSLGQTEKRTPGSSDVSREQLGLRSPLVRGLLIALVVIVVVVSIGVIGATFVRGSWWYAMSTDRALNEAERVRLVEVREAVAASGAARRAVAWLDMALDAEAHPSDVRLHLMAAADELEQMADPELTEELAELETLIGSMSRGRSEATMPSPFPPSTVAVSAD